MTTPNEHGFIVTSTARTEASEEKATKAVTPAESTHETADDENLEDSAISKTQSDDDLDDESSESDDADDAQNEEQKPKKNSLKKRFNKLTQARKIAEERALKAEQMLAQLQQGSGNKPQEEKPQEQKQKVEDGRPTPDHFDTHSDYIEALTDWKLEQKDKKAAEAAAKTKAQEQEQQLQKSYDDKVKEFKKTAPDFDEAIDDVVHLVRSQTFLQAIVTSDFGPQIAYELAQNPKEIERLQSISPASLYKEIGKLEDKFSKASTQASETKQIKTTNAPRPISPVGSSSASVNKSLSDPNLTYAEYEALRLKQLKKNK